MGNEKGRARTAYASLRETIVLMSVPEQFDDPARHPARCRLAIGIPKAHAAAHDIDRTLDGLGVCLVHTGHALNHAAQALMLADVDDVVDLVARPQDRGEVSGNPGNALL